MTLPELQALITAGRVRLGIPQPISPSCALCGRAVGSIVTASYPDMASRSMSLCNPCVAHLFPKQGEKQAGTWPEPCKTLKEVKP